MDPVWVWPFPFVRINKDAESAGGHALAPLRMVNVDSKIFGDTYGKYIVYCRIFGILILVRIVILNRILLHGFVSHGDVTRIAKLDQGVRKRFA